MAGELTKNAGMVAVVGSANAGKSTLVNRLVGEKVAVVSPVAQTTRNIVRAIWTEPRGQLVFIDTPGVHKAQYDLGRLMNRMARGAVEGVDVALLVLDACRPPREEDEGWMRRLMRPDQEAAVVIALNKVDAGSRHSQAYRALWDRVATEKSHNAAVEWLETSGVTGQGVEPLMQLLFDRVPAGPPLFPDDILTDYPRKLQMADVIRERFILRLKDELPHAIAISIEDIEEKDVWRVAGTVFVDKHSQKGIVLGAKGRLLKTVEREAAAELQEMYDHPFKISLWVKVEKDWARNFWMLKRLGYA